MTAKADDMIKTENLERMHDLKCWPQFFEKLVDGSKPFEIRKNDRDYRVGDKLRLREWNPDTEDYSGRTVGRVVTYVTAFNQSPGWVVMGVRG